MSKAYELISKYYGDKCAKRSGVPLINHIDEGRIILEYLETSDIVKDAYYLHPILQSDKDFYINKTLDFEGIPSEVLLMVCEYRRVANSYLSNKTEDDFVGFPFLEIKRMLIADKIQNYKDFMLYHHGKHERSDELYQYFHSWFRLLEIDYKKILKECFGYIE